MFGRDSLLLASGSEDTTIRLWDVSSGQCVNVLEGHEDQARSVAFSPDGLLLAGGSEDNTICLWNVGGRRCLNIKELLPVEAMMERSIFGIERVESVCKH